MALIDCEECGKEISDKAKACIHCGAPTEQEEEYIPPSSKEYKSKFGEVEKPKRTFIGKIIKFIFIAFNIFMAWWMFEGMSGASDVISTSGNQYEKAGAQIGTAIGFSFILGVWALGDIILGLFVLLTRPK